VTPLLQNETKRKIQQIKEPKPTKSEVKLFTHTHKQMPEKVPTNFGQIFANTTKKDKQKSAE